MIAPVILEGTHVRLEPLSSKHVTPLTESDRAEIWRWMTVQVRDRNDMQRYVDKPWTLTATELPSRLRPWSGPATRGGYDAFRQYRSFQPPRRDWMDLDQSEVAAESHQHRSEAPDVTSRLRGVGCIRVEFKTDALNDKSRAALLRIGAKEEGMLRKHMIADTGRFATASTTASWTRSGPRSRLHWS